MTASPTIAAIATAPSPAGVGIIRISGPKAIETAASLCQVQSDSFEPRRLSLRTLWGGEKQALDKALVVVMPGPASFTGEDVAEIHCHGGPLLLDKVLARVLQLGARVAAPGEFSRRAWQNGKLSVLEAEAMLEPIGAGSERALRLAQAQQQGALGQACEDIVEKANGVRATVEAYIDFPEDDLPDSDRESLVVSLDDIIGRLQALASSYQANRSVLDGISVVLSGPVNAGKSSLFNALVGKDRALVSSEAGTTRDFIEATVQWEGIAFTLIDTAGTRDAESDVERAGIALGSNRAAQADVVVALVGPEQSTPHVDDRTIVVASKVDIWDPPNSFIATSANTGAGLDKVRQAVIEKASGAGFSDPTGVTTARQLDCVNQALERAKAARGLLASQGESELVAIELRELAESLERLVGRELSESMLDALFSKFCIGK